LPLE